MAFPSSQLSSSQNRPQIFVSADDSPLQIFVESNGVSENRPKLMRTLRNHGASICVDVSRARIILVDPSSSEGRLFVRDWGMDPGKVILEVAWVHRCLSAGRALLENDSWGGCGNLDGTPLPGDEVDDDNPGPSTSASSSKHAFSLNDVPPRTQSVASMNSSTPPSLPTPRQTPVEHGSSRTEVYSMNQRFPSIFQRLPTPPTTSSFTQYPSQPLEPSRIETQQISHSIQSGPSMAVSPYDMSVARPAQFPNFPLTPQAMQSILMNNPDFMAAAMNMMMQGMASPFSNTPAWPSQPQAPNHQYMQPPPAFPQMHSQPPQHVNMPPPPPPHMNGHYANMQTQQYGDPSPTSIKIEPHYSPSPIDPGPQYDDPHRTPSPQPTFTAVHVRMSESPPPPSAMSVEERSILSQKGKKRSRDTDASASSSKQAKRRSRSPSVPSSSRREKNRLSTDSVRQPGQNNHVKKEHPIPIGIFTARDGSPVKFFLQVQIKNRIELVAQVKKNGGQITFEPADANYIILTPHGGKFTDQWMKVVKDLKRSALRPGFIEACLEEDAIVEDEDFRIEPVKRGRKSSAAMPLAPTREDSEEEVHAPAHDGSSNGSGRLRSPTPPSGRISLLSGGRHAFTAEERAYVLKYAVHVFRKKPDATLHLLGAEISRRVTTHSQASWTNTVYQYRKEIEKIRDTVVVEKHDSMDESPGSEPEESQVEEALLDVQKDGRPSLPPTHHNGDAEARVYDAKEEHLENSETDFNTIIGFFANPPEGLVQDDLLWAALEREHKCITAPSWQDFYESHMEKVNQRLRQALNLESAEGEENSPVEVPEAPAQVSVEQDS